MNKGVTPPRYLFVGRVHRGRGSVQQAFSASFPFTFHSTFSECPYSSCLGPSSSFPSVSIGCPTIFYTFPVFSTLRGERHLDLSTDFFGSTSNVFTWFGLERGTLHSSEIPASRSTNAS